MLAEAGGARAAKPPVAVIVALAAERVAFRRVESRLPHTRLIQCGPGPERAAQAAQRALEQGAGALVSFGVAGGLSNSVASGTLLVPREIVGASRLSTDQSWVERIVAALDGVVICSTSALLAVDDVLETPAAKAAAAGDSGAVAVDLESGALARVAHAAGVPFVALRAIADDAGDTLPPGVEAWVDDTGQSRLGPVAAALGRPSNWAAFATLARRYRSARRTLELAASRLGPEGFLHAAG